MSDLLQFCRREQPWLAAAIESLVLAESPTTDVDAVEACGGRVTTLMEELGGAVELRSGAGGAAHRLGVFGSQAPARTVLMLGHFDTVWPIGQLARMPLVERDGAWYGPGIFDMKAGLALALQALRALQHDGWPDGLMVRCLWTADEETGSATSRALIESEARQADAVFVFEPALSGGAVKTARKGVGQFQLRATGVSAHAGIEPGAGASAVHALARAIVALDALNDPDRGISVNAGVIAGGTRSNVIAECAEADIDVRIARAEDAKAVEHALHALADADPRIRITVTGGINRPPLERTAGVARLYALARDAAGEVGVDVAEGATGGASDGNFTGALGVPTLDGLGAIGGGAHALDEHVQIDALPARAALAATLLRRFRTADLQ